MRTSAWFVAAASVFAAVPLHAQEASTGLPQAQARAADVGAFWKGEKAYDAVFAQVFQDAISQDKFSQIGTQLAAQFGAFQGVENVEPIGAGTYAIALRFERAIARGQMHLEAGLPYRIDGFNLGQFEPRNDSAEMILADLRALPGVTSALFVALDGGAPLLSYESQRELAIGSTMKLYVLSALAHQIAAGQRKWSDVVTLGQRSLPSGQMQDWPKDAPVTLATLATMMISISDNTATDTLIRLVGQSALEAELVASHHSNPLIDRPFLTTRQMFQLKGGDDAALAAYPSASPAARARILGPLDQQAVDPSTLMKKFGATPRALDVEWFASSRDIAGIFDRLRQLGDQTALGILAVNPGIKLDRQKWTYVGYKGGSEPGVLNLSWLLRHKSGRWYVATLGWNNPAAVVPTNTLELFLSRIVALAPDN